MATKTYDPEWLDMMYNNRARVPEHADHFARWEDWSKKARKSHHCRLDVRYGDGPNETLDIFPSKNPNAPVLFFIHGGWWRSLDKSDHSFVAPGFVDAGACVVVPNYALCPGTADCGVTVPSIVMQMVEALAWTWRNVARYGGDPKRITVAGHSAGGHLAAMMLACEWTAYDPALPQDLVENAMSISGLHELESVQHTPMVKDSLRLTDEHVARASPAWLPAPAHGVLYAMVGAAESPEFVRQNQLIRDAWGAHIVPVCEAMPGLNHYTALEAIADISHPLHGRVLELLRM